MLVNNADFYCYEPNKNQTEEKNLRFRQIGNIDHSLFFDPGPNRTADLPLRRRPLYPLSYRTIVIGIYIIDLIVNLS